MKLSIRTRAIMALIVTGILGGVAPLFMKTALKECTVAQIIFIRFGIATILIIPFFVRYIKKNQLKKITLAIPAGLLFSGNIFLFVIGLQFTTSIVSQLFYQLGPVIVSLLGYMLFHEKISGRRALSMAICFFGAALLISRSIQTAHLIQSIGTFKGNMLVISAVICWSLYALYTKKFSTTIEPSFFLVVNFLTSFVISICMLIINNVSLIGTVTLFIHSSAPAMLSLIALGTLNSVLFFFLYQWSLKQVSAFIVISTTYLSPFSTAVFAIPFFGEKLSSILLISAACICIGSYLIITEKKSYQR